MLRTSWALSLVVLLSIGSCSRGASEGELQGGQGGAVLGEVEGKLRARLGAVRDYVLEGTARDAGTEVHFKYAFAQPRFARLELGDQETVVFDGEVMLALDHRTKSAARVDKGIGEENLLLALHQTFSAFACEGWRPPLLRPGMTRATVTQGPEGSRFTLTVPIDDAQLKEDRVVLRGDGSFVEKNTVDRQGATVATTRVIEDLVDPTTGLTFPRRWEKKGAGGALEVALTRATVNGGITRDSFLPTIPTGYTLANKGTP